VKYQAVIFDLFGTLVENSPSSKSYEVLSRMATILAVSPADFAAQWRTDIVNRMSGITKNYQACIRNICRRLGARPGDEQIEKAARIRFEMNQHEVMTYKPGALEVLSYLKANGYKTALLSNCSMETTTIWPKTSLAPLIDVPVMSCIEGMLKPDPRLFQIAIEKLAVKPEACLYVADGVGQELTTAAELGMCAVLVATPHDSEYEHDRETWQGLKISSLKEVLNLVK
jgi:putative hydrolase of the HAD superfamily